ncbi:hypothetical protein, partial [Candidatus Albibeggiatoa sp. nov. BB20]|uniref:hypothetical protein n=1 Tax=Candidatus Albibeggiatoa sp. nov. BB20 TaxID=3162723 RepID=UPI00336535AC
NKTIDFIGQCIYDFVDMFSILMYTTTYPEFISVSVEEKGKFILYPSMAISKEAIEQWKNENLSYNDTSIKSYPLSPYPDETNQYCKNCIDIKAVITKWLEKRHDFSIIAQEIQSRTKYSNLYKAYGKIVLYAAQLEAIAKLELELSEEEKEPCTQKCTIKQEVEECKKSKQKKRNTLINNIKYAYTINKYANIKIKDQLCLLLPPPDHDSSKKYVERKRQIKEQLELLPPDHDSLGIEKHLDLGTQVSGLRSDIIHSASKPRDELKVLNTLKIIEIGRISGYIEMIVLGYVLSKLEIDCHIISKYQDRFTYP